MSWNAPQNWNEALSSIERGFDFSARPLGVKGISAGQVCGNSRREISGHLDDFTREIFQSSDEVNARYKEGGRVHALRADDVVYIVTRDGNALAYVTRVGAIKINPTTERAERRYVDALRRIEPALSKLAAQLAATDPSRWL